MEDSEYLARTLRLKPIIEADHIVLQRAAEAFAAVYDNRMADYGSIILPPELVELGSGKDHVVIGLGRSIVDPSGNRLVHLAIKLKLRDPYGEFGLFDVGLEELVGAYHAAFERRKNPPYFVSVVTSEASYLGRQRRLAGIIIEDVSNGKTLRLIERPDYDDCKRILPDGSSETIYLDPGYGAKSWDGDRYLTPEARIDLP